MKTLRMGAPVRLGDLELIPIEATAVRAETIGGALTAFASKEAAAVVIRSPSGLRALGLDGEDISMDELAREVPGLRGRA